MLLKSSDFPAFILNEIYIFHHTPVLLISARPGADHRNGANGSMSTLLSDRVDIFTFHCYNILRFKGVLK